VLDAPLRVEHHSSPPVPLGFLPLFPASHLGHVRLDVGDLKPAALPSICRRSSQNSRRRPSGDDAAVTVAAAAAAAASTQFGEEAGFGLLGGKTISGHF